MADAKCPWGVTKELQMIIVAGESVWVAIFMVTVNLLVSKKMATNKMVTMAACSLTLCPYGLCIPNTFGVASLK